MRRPSLSYANVTATLALILALGGTSYAAVTINGADIKRKSIPLNRLKGKPPTGARGPIGPQGAKGETGSQGPPGLISDTVFDGGPLSDQPQGQDVAVLTATGLAAGSYLVTYRLDVFPAQRYTCALASGTLLGPTAVVSSRTTNSGPDPETFESTGMVTTLQAGQDQILSCSGASSDWSVDSSELHFLRVDQVSDGVEG
jgi:hypothetical protein